MNLQQLKVFVLTVKYKSLTVVARELDIQQPTVTFHLNRLQESCGVPLFISGSHRLLKLTDAGYSLYHYAQQMVAIENELRHTLESYQDLRKGRLVIGSTYSPATYVLPRLLAEFKSSYPDIELALEVKTAPVVIDMVKKYELDLGIISYDRINDKELAFHRLYRDNLILVMPPDHPLASRGELSAEDLAGIPIIAHERQSVSRRMVDEWAETVGIQLNVVMEVSATETMKEIAMNGMGAAILSERGCKRELENGKLVGRELPACSFERDIYLIHLKSKLMMPAMLQFMELLKLNTLEGD